MATKPGVVFEDFFPSMVEKMGAEGFMNELCNGFRLLMDGDKGVITFESLKKNSAVLGLQNMSDDELICMLREGDLDGDGSLNQMEFCVLMFRLSPELMKECGVVASWVKQFRIDLCGVLRKPIGLRKNGEVFSAASEEYLVSYDPESKSIGICFMWILTWRA
ncbi:hypothetical protein TEA_028665 [Camellia sinensis var. sinensis]|uniref:EF-hand domain-containing protein n=1 Tax=Camellia sinensis var. sinensis TaxID=542762 RepID=A0A4S4EXC7_CAMSN|nr:hypothetical protein TEA_028665 [Camellia sinensis var. sinensis]